MLDKLTAILSDYFEVGRNCYHYILERVKYAELTAKDFREYNEDVVAEIAEYLIDNGVTIQRWIPVTEKMPEDFVSVLIVAPGEHPLPLVHEAYHANNCWVTLSVIYNDDEITHWTPLPEPPKEVE